MRTVGGRRCGRCGGRLVEGVLTGLHVCWRCGWGFTESGRGICPSCVRGECGLCVSWWSEDEDCGHECLHQAGYGRPEDIGYITPDDW